MRAFVLLAFLIAARVAIGESLSVNQAINPSHYRIIAAPASDTAFLGSSRGFRWVDDKRLLFVANDRELSDTQRRGSRTAVTRAVPTIHLWNFAEGTLQRYRSEPLISYLCAVDGRVWYGLKGPAGDAFYEGRFGEEREVSRQPDRLGSDGRPLPRGFNHFACMDYWHADVPRPNGGRSFLLRREHGVLENLGTDHLGNLVWDGQFPPFKRWLHADGKSIEIAFPQERISQPLKYSHLAAGYLFARAEGRRVRGMTNKIYLWRPLIDVRFLEIAGSQNWSALTDADITQAGIVAKSSLPVADPRAKWDAGPAGVYLLRGPVIDQFLRTVEQPFSRNSSQYGIVAERINRGLIDEISGVSPDGCKVAVVIDPYDREDRQIRLEAIDFCIKKG